MCIAASAEGELTCICVPRDALAKLASPLSRWLEDVAAEMNSSAMGGVDANVLSKASEDGLDLEKMLATKAAKSTKRGGGGGANEERAWVGSSKRRSSNASPSGKGEVKA